MKGLIFFACIGISFVAIPCFAGGINLNHVLVKDSKDMPLLMDHDFTITNDTIDSGKWYKELKNKDISCRFELEVEANTTVQIPAGTPVYFHVVKSNRFNPFTEDELGVYSVATKQKLLTVTCETRVNEMAYDSRCGGNGGTIPAALMIDCAYRDNKIKVGSKMVHLNARDIWFKHLLDVFGAHPIPIEPTISILPALAGQETPSTCESCLQ